jgi:RHS repeat-associated protein
VYVSNESQLNVYFDNLQVTHTRGRLLEESHYYPFGLTMAGISSKALGFGEPGNKIKFQDQEFASKEFSDGSGLEMYEFKWRMHDPQTGRFWQVDPLSEKYVYNSTYAFSENKVISHRELEGLEAQLAIAGTGNKYKPEDTRTFKDRADRLSKNTDFDVKTVNNGMGVLNALKEATAQEGSVGAVVIFAHAGGNGIYMDQDEGFYTDNAGYGKDGSANVSNIKGAVDNGEIKFDKDAIVVFGGCNCANPGAEGKPSIAESMTGKLGVTTYAATGFVQEEVVNGKATGRIETTGNGTFIKHEKVVTVRMEGIWPKVTESIKKTDVGKHVDPKSL